MIGPTTAVPDRKYNRGKITNGPPEASTPTDPPDSDRPTSFQVSAPTLSLPKGGRAIRGMGESFAASLVTGTGSMSVPIATPPGRAGFGPQLSLSYDSGAGNGPFGFGWSLSLPSITCKTDKGLPRYNDSEDSDVFILSGAEDLVPVLDAQDSRFEDATSAVLLDLSPKNFSLGQI